MTSLKTRQGYDIANYIITVGCKVLYIYRINFEQIYLLLDMIRKLDLKIRT